MRYNETYRLIGIFCAVFEVGKIVDVESGISYILPTGAGAVVYEEPHIFRRSGIA